MYYLPLRIGHSSAQTLLGIVAPVLTVETNKHRRIRDRHRRFKNEYMHGLTGLVDAPDQLFVREGFDRNSGQQFADGGAIGGHSATRSAHAPLMVAAAIASAGNIFMWVQASDIAIGILKVGEVPGL